jgi:hypothetical protein
MIQSDDDLTAEEQLLDDLAECYADPLHHVLMSYPWGEGQLTGRNGPMTWQRDFLIQLGDEVKQRAFDGVHAVTPIQFSTVSGHGVGKSCLTAWIIRWIMDTRPFARGVVTANTKEQLRTKTWAELAKWHNLGITNDWYTLNAGGSGSLNLYHREHGEMWRVDAVTSDEHNSDAFAGQHNLTSTSFYIFDEAAGIHDKIHEVRSGGLTDGEPMTFDFGNGTRNSGAFFKNMTGKLRHRFIRRHIDSRDVEITNKEYLERLIADHGIDSDYIKVRVLGQFPSASAKQFISTADVDAGVGREMMRHQYNFAPVIIGVDPAWTGDDEFVIYMRQGLSSKILGVYDRNDDDVQMANLIAQFEDDYRADAVFVDGGFGTGIVSVGSAMGREWTIVWFASASSDPGCLNKRADIWNEMRKWLKAGGSIEDDDDLRSDLTGVELVPRVDGKKQLESKDHMRSRGLASPGRGDALALTFSFPVASKSVAFNPPAVDQMQSDYDPLQ